MRSAIKSFRVLLAATIADIMLFGTLFVVGKQLFGVLWQTVAAVSKGWIVVMCADSRVQSDTLNNLFGI